MNKNWLFAIVGVFLLGAIALVSAHGFGAANSVNRASVEMGGFMGSGARGMMHGGMMQYHEDMEKIMEEGTYEDLVNFRQKIGFDIMPFVDDEESFKQMQEHHEQMEKLREEGSVRGFGMHGGRFGGCPMMDNS